MINYLTLLLKPSVFNRMKHSNIIYDATTNRTLIDNSLIKALETARARKIRKTRNTEKIAIKKESEKQTTFEMSESHDSKPFYKEYK